MDRSISGSPTPLVTVPSNGERRRSVRQKLHSPVYVSFNGPRTGMVLDLSELLDLQEDGFAVQTSEPLEMNRAVTLCLDLPETKSYIHGSGQVIWSDKTGRGGIRFSALPEKSRHVLKEWLFANLLIACSNHAARTEQLAHRQAEKDEKLEEESEERLPPALPSSSVAARADQGEELSPMEALRREVIQIGGDFDGVLELITERALTLTGASGAAAAFLTAAFLTNDQMICRARAGEPAPPLGTPVDIKQGLSGECVRSGALVCSEDSENDPRIDPAIGRALGIRSLMAVPIVSDFRVVGLLEVFSPQMGAFTQTHAAVLQRLVEMIPKHHPKQSQAREKLPEDASLNQTEKLSHPAAAESGVTEFDSIPSICEARREPSNDQSADALGVQQPEAPLQAADVSAETVSDQVSEQVSGQDPETAPAAHSRLLYRALLGLAIAVVALVVGYLLGPVIERRWADSPQAAGRSATPGTNAVSAQRPTAVSLNDQRAQPKTLPDLQKLAEQGDPEAQWQMGVRYHDGTGVPQDDSMAMQWFLRAAEQGQVDAQAHLGAYYWAGRGVPEDLIKAYMWSAIALAGGDHNSKSRLEGLASQMTREQVSVARQQAEAWLHSHNQPTRAD